MNTEENNSKISITAEAIRYITFYYFSVAFILTIAQVVYEYYDIKKNIYSSISDLSQSFNHSLTNSLWEFNEVQTETILTGILKSPNTLGVKLQRLNGSTLKSIGESDDSTQSNGFFNAINPNILFKHEIELEKKLENGLIQKVGTLSIYSGNKVILEQLSRIIFYVIINFILKTLSLWAVLILFFTYKVKNPLRTLVNGIKKIDPQNPCPIILDPKSADTLEVFQIAESFNQLINKLNNFKEILEAIIDNKTELLKEKNMEVGNLISKLEQAQGKIINQEKLNSLGMVSAGMAHELKNPLNLCKNTVLILKNYLNMNSNYEFNEKQISMDNLKRIPELVKILVDNNDRMETIIKNMLLQSRTENTKPTPINISTFVKLNLSIVQKSLKASSATSAEIVFDIEKEVTIDIFASEIGRLLVNLFENAFFALDEKLKEMNQFKPRLAVTIKTEGNNGIILSIRDNGPGVPQNLINKIIEPFFTTKPTGIGTGLGLYLSYEIVKKHRGKMTISSELGSYTDVEIYLPKNLSEYYN